MKIRRVPDLVIVIIKDGLDPLHGLRVFLGLGISCIIDYGQSGRTLYRTSCVSV